MDFGNAESRDEATGVYSGCSERGECILYTANGDVLGRSRCFQQYVCVCVCVCVCLCVYGHTSETHSIRKRLQVGERHTGHRRGETVKICALRSVGREVSRVDAHVCMHMFAGWRLAGARASPTKHAQTISCPVETEGMRRKWWGTGKNDPVPC